MNLKPIVMDIETSGLDKVKCGIWQIGAIDLNNPEEYFLEEGRIDNENIVEPNALKINGKTEEELRNQNKQSQKQMFENFFEWIKKRPMINFLCQNPDFDVGFIEVKAKHYELEIPFHYRSFDLHSITQTKYHDLNGVFLIERGHSSMSLPKILEFCGMNDERKAHNALEDCKLTGEAFSRIFYGKNLFPGYSQFEIPEYLIKISKEKK